MEVISLQNISFNYGPVRALDDVNLVLEEGVVGLLGPNGAGKTTLIKVLLGLLKPDSGAGAILGRDIWHDSRIIRQRVGYMPETDCLLPGMDAVTLTAYLGELSGMPRREAIKRAHEVLYYVGLDESRYRRVETYSAGMKQRLKLAQALVHDPKLLLLDEPTSGLDPGGRKEMLELIRDVASKSSMNIIISSHLLPDVENTCQQVVMLDQGKIIAQSAIQELHGKALNWFEIRVTGNRESFFDRLSSRGCRIEPHDRGLWRVEFSKDFKVADVFQAALQCGVQIRHFKQSRTSLEDNFMAVIGGGNDH